ncbi:alkaline phosphatase [Abyssalbus ytuae]|uniref:Alkaline phosphatase n=1 Tax=Abyssalbus ytuae TaxID=2926907 RepID=A0A9E6ZQ40_9FLAO|nr:alkaline phosphatase [Abyssalbus ytuae]UOB18440.1 alkaline phosphatase [Abyssalbus ytuae]
MKLKKSIFICLVFVLLSCKSSNIGNTKVDTPKNVILLISDGAGLSQISSTFYFKESLPNYTRFENIGLIKTSSSKEDVTDSAAGATAFACGVKTYNGAIGLATDSTVVKNMVEIASLKNIKTGVIATSSITHATPACFYAHVLNRGLEEDIARHLTQSEVDFFAAGGLKYFNDRKDGQNLLTTLKEKNFTIDTKALSDFSEIKSEEKVGFLLAEKEMPRISEGRGGFLSQATELGIKYLSKDNSGFFIMSEGSQVDWGGHENNASYLVSEMIDFDEAVGKVLDFAKEDGNTLVIVTSDHETGGFTLAAKKKKRDDGSEYSDYREIGMTFSTGGHSATLIPVFAYGPGSEEFKGVYENNDIFEKILKVTQWRK